MTFLYKYGAPFQWRPIRDVLQRWRLSLASLLVFTILLADNLGLSLGLTKTNRTMKYAALTSSLGNMNNFTIPFWSARGLLWNSTPRQQCLVLNQYSIKDICSQGSYGNLQDWLRSFKRTRTLEFCNEYQVFNVLDPLCFDLFDGSKKKTKESERTCTKCLEKIYSLDCQAQEAYENFQGIFSLYDCAYNFSVKWNCSMCREAYKKWVCSHHIPYYLNRQQVRPCPSYCNDVSQQCPYLLPHVDYQYAGEPSFVCTDSLSSPSAGDGQMNNSVCFAPCGYGNDSNQLCPITVDDTSTGSETNTTSSATSIYSLTHTRTKWCKFIHGLLSTIIAQLTILWHTRTLERHHVIGLT